ncbi:MAG: D-alanyl-D-alanine carboxypeptidase/D-alanyl-D-alanine-endopeptidase [Candidatus Berkiella sp.]
MIHKSLSFCWLALFTCNVSATATNNIQPNHENLPAQISQFVQEKFPNAQVGIVIQSAKTGDILYQQQADQYFYPASNTKLFLAAAALKTLGESYRFQTRLLNDEKSLYIQFRGDPTLRMEDINQLIAKLKENKIDTLYGDVIIDDNTFSGPVYSQGWTWDSLPWYYSAPVSSIIINQNKAQVKIQETKILKEAVHFEAASSFPSLKIKSNVIGVNKATADTHCQLDVYQNANEVDISGCWSIEKTPLTLELSLQDTRLLAKQAVQHALETNKIELKGDIHFGKISENAKVIAVHASQPLSQLLKPVLSDSNNIVSDAITKTLGLARSNQGSFQEGVNAIKATLSESFNLPAEQYRLFDGSGISRYTLISPTFISELLYQMQKDPTFSAFENALSHAAENGSLAFRMKAPTLKNKIAAKTGTAMGTSALSGYLEAKSGEKYIFSIVINQSLEKSENLKLAEDKLCELLFEAL